MAFGVVYYLEIIQINKCHMERDSNIHLKVLPEGIAISQVCKRVFGRDGLQKIIDFSQFFVCLFKFFIGVPQLNSCAVPIPFKNGYA